MLLQADPSGWFLAELLIFLKLGALTMIAAPISVKRRGRSTGSKSRKEAGEISAAWVEREISRLRAGKAPSESLLKQLSAQERALFEVSVIDALNTAPGEGQRRLRSALVSCGYDDLCARRTMGEDLSDRVRAASLLALLRPHWRDQATKDGRRRTDHRTAIGRAAAGDTGPLDSE